MTNRLNLMFYRRNLYFPKYSKWVFILLFVFTSVFYEIPEKLFYKPQGIHAWRQSDCLSITMNYYNEGMDFFNPKIHNLSNDNTGRTVSDFPLLYYTAAILWRVFGQHEFIYRLLVLLTAITGLYCLFLTMETLFKESFWALGISLLVYTSPLFVYYANNFLSNIPALSLVFIAWYFLFKFYRKGASRYLLFSMFFFLLGGLLKTTSLYTYVPVLFIFLTEISGLFKYRGDSRIFNKPLIQFIPVILVPALVFLWYLWAFNYNKRYNSNIFLIGILPVWDLSAEQIRNVWHYINVLWLREYFHISVQIVSVVFYLGMIVSFRKMNRTIYTTLVLMGLGFFMYLSFWFQVLDHHDYYLIDLLALIIITLLSFLYFLKVNYPGIFESLLLKTIFLLFLLFQICYCRTRINERYIGWRNAKHIEYFQPLETITPYLRNLGIERDDKVISIPDESLNITLYMMDQKGWTNFNFPDKIADSAIIVEKIRFGAKYLVINDTTGINTDDFKGLIKMKAGNYGHVNIYELNEAEDLQVPYE